MSSHYTDQISSKINATKIIYAVGLLHVMLSRIL